MNHEERVWKESVCDFDSGTSTEIVRQKGRGPYWYVREAREIPHEAECFRRQCVHVLYTTEGTEVVNFCWSLKYDTPCEQPTVLERVAKFIPEAEEIKHH